MPSVGRIKQLSVLGVAIAALGISASSASAANDVWLWACHGPGGQDLGASSVRSGRGLQRRDGSPTATRASGGASGGLGDGGHSAVLSQQAGGQNQPVDGRSEAFMRLDVPPDLTLAKVRLQRQTRGFSGAQQLGNKQSYEVFAGATGTKRSLERITLEDAAPANVDGEATFDIPAPPSGSGDSVTVCGQVRQPAQPSMPGFGADRGRRRPRRPDGQRHDEADDGRRRHAQSGRRASSTSMSRRATTGTGLRKVIAYLDGRHRRSRSVRVPLGARLPQLQGPDARQRDGRSAARRRLRDGRQRPVRADRAGAGRGRS